MQIWNSLLAHLRALCTMNCGLVKARKSYQFLSIPASKKKKKTTNTIGINLFHTNSSNKQHTFRMVKIISFYHEFQIWIQSGQVTSTLHNIIQKYWQSCYKFFSIINTNNFAARVWHEGSIKLNQSYTNPQRYLFLGFREYLWKNLVASFYN